MDTERTRIPDKKRKTDLKKSEDEILSLQYHRPLERH